MSALRGLLCGALSLLLALAGRAAGEPLRGTLVIFHAGSLAVPMEQLCREFGRRHPGLEIQREADGSRNCARKISELGRACDVLATSDYRVIDDLLIPRHAAWNIRFASNEMVLAANPGALRTRGLTVANCFDRFLKGELTFGRSDPNADPCGYRTVHTLRLAERLLKRPGLADSLLALSHRHIRPKEVDLLALLEMGEIDCLFIYRSVAAQHGLDILELPAAINLGNPALDGEYRQAWAEISGREPGQTVRVTGESMVYGVTIPKGCPNPAAALAFVRFLLTREEGGEILARLGQPSVVPAPTPTWDALPGGLRVFARPVGR